MQFWSLSTGSDNLTFAPNADQLNSLLTGEGLASYHWRVCNGKYTSN